MNNHNSQEVTVSIICDCYNHEKYIRECLDGFVMQQCNFKFEVLVHDDASTDNSAAIIKEYMDRHPDIIKPIYQTKNQYSSGGNIWGKYQFPRAKGKYIAMCEGDDYWTDPLKLQKQVNFLEKNEDYSICFHRISELENGNENTLINEFCPENEDKTYTAQDLSKGNFITTVSVMYRKETVNIPFWIEISPIGDYPLHLSVSEHGKIKYLHDDMATYRKGSGIWSVLSQEKQLQKLVFCLDLLIYHFRNNQIVKKNLEQQKYNYYKSLYKNNLENRSNIGVKQLIKMLLCKVKLKF